ncbi:DUF4113 domain-containing protein [Yersinia enterocolitica]|nr:DUF4113 domain-containing protein [Yersinia enterocolitica]
MIAISMRRSISDKREYWNYRWWDSSSLPMEASINPSHKQLRPEKWEASLDRAGNSHIDMFDETPPRANSEQLMNVIDSINREGIGKVWFAGQGIDKDWKMKREILSPAYTTRWGDLPKVQL